MDVLQRDQFNPQPDEWGAAKSQWMQDPGASTLIQSGPLSIRLPPLLIPVPTMRRATQALRYLLDYPTLSDYASKEPYWLSDLLNFITRVVSDMEQMWVCSGDVPIQAE